MEKTLERQMQNAQAQLMQRASLLMIMGMNEGVHTYMSPYTHSFSFHFGEVNVCFDKEQPFDQDVIDATIVRMDGMIEAAYAQAQNTIKVVKAWRGE